MPLEGAPLNDGTEFVPMNWEAPPKGGREGEDSESDDSGNDP